MPLSSQTCHSVNMQHLQDPASQSGYGSGCPSLTHSTSAPVVTTPACPPLWTVFSEYCSNKKLAINHIALLRLRALPAHRAPSIGRCASSVGLYARDIGAVVNPASFFGTGDWEKGALLELSIKLFLARLAFSVLLPATR